MPTFDNTKIRYRLIKELYLRHAHPDVPVTRTFEKFVKPIYPISRTTLYKILNTPDDKLMF